MLNKFLLKLSLKYQGKSNFEIPVAQQAQYIGKFREPRSLIERSFFQYKTQMMFKGFWLTMAINLASMPLFCLYFLTPSKRIKGSYSADAVFVKDGGVNNNILPKSLFSEFEKLELDAKEGSKLKFRDRLYILKLLLRYPLSWNFALKSVLKITRYRWLIELYKPKALIVHNEYSFTSSMLTDFCNRNGVELINVMHGEKLYNSGNSFFAFNRCYIWSEFYRDLLTELRADPKQFVIEQPPALIFETKDVAKTVDFTYYLQTQTGRNLKFIIDMLVRLQEKGNKVAIRPHPRFTNLPELEECIAGTGIELESVKEITIETSILRTKNVVSVYSTVLQQAYFNSVNVVMDDISNKALFNRLKEYKHMILSCEHTTLSNLLL